MSFRRRSNHAAVLLLVIAFALPLQAARVRFGGRVVSVHDGDTISVLVARRAVKVRLEGIDCPELGQPYGRSARLFTSSRVFGRWVAVEQTTVDRYGRRVGRVFVDGEDLNTAILAAGLAWHYTQYSNDRAMDAAEQAARAAHRGLWSQPNPVPPWVYRRPGSKAQNRMTRAPSAPRSTGLPVARTSAPSSGPFHGNVRSHVFHAPGCRSYNCTNCTAVFATRDEALAQGYKPAGDCGTPARQF